MLRSDRSALLGIPRERAARRREGARSRCMLAHANALPPLDCLRPGRGRRREPRRHVEARRRLGFRSVPYAVRAHRMRVVARQTSVRRFRRRRAPSAEARALPLRVGARDDAAVARPGVDRLRRRYGARSDESYGRLLRHDVARRRVRMRVVAERTALFERRRTRLLHLDGRVVPLLAARPKAQYLYGSKGGRSMSRTLSLSSKYKADQR